MMNKQDKSFNFGTAKEAGWAPAIFVKMDAVNLQGVWSSFPEEETLATTGHAPKIGAFIYYLLNEQRKRKLTGQEILDKAQAHRVLTLDESIKRFEIQEATDFALLFAEA